MTGIAPALMIAGTLVSAVGQYQQSQSQAASYAYSAASARQNALEASAAGSVAAGDEARKTAYALSDTAARAAGSGVNPGFGSPVAQSGRIAKFGTFNQLMAMYDANVQSTGLQNEAGGLDFAASQARAAAPYKVAGTLISGGDTLYSKYGSDPFSSGTSPAASAPSISDLGAYG